MDTYKFFISLIKDDITQVKEKLEILPNRTFLHQILSSDEKQVLDEIPLLRAIKNLEIIEDKLWGEFEFDEFRILHDVYTDQDVYLRTRSETKFCYFLYLDKYYCITFPRRKGRKELQWFFKTCYERKTNNIRGFKFPITMIESFMEVTDSIAKLLEVPQVGSSSDYIIFKGPNVKKDRLYVLARQRGKEPTRGLLNLPRIGWEIKINPGGTIQCYQNPMSRFAINFFKQSIMPHIY